MTLGYIVVGVFLGFGIACLLAWYVDRSGTWGP